MSVVTRLLQTFTFDIFLRIHYKNYVNKLNFDVRLNYFGINLLDVSDRYLSVFNWINIIKVSNTIKLLQQTLKSYYIIYEWRKQWVSRNNEFKENSCIIKLLLFKTSHILIYISLVVIKYKYLNSYLVCLKNTFV